MRWLIVVVALLTACTGPTTDPSQAGRTEVEAIMRAAAAQGGGATCIGGGSLEESWTVCLMLVNRQLQIVRPNSGRAQDGERLSLELEPADLDEPIRAELDALPINGIVWAGGAYEGTIRDENGQPVGSFSGTLPG